MPELHRSLAAWGTPAFEAVFKEELAAFGPDALGLQQAVSSGSVATDGSVGVMVLGTSEQGHSLRIRVGLFFTSVIAGCACADDPTPVGEQAEYCEIELLIDRHSGEVERTPGEP
jgi:hypothetical protein